MMCEPRPPPTTSKKIIVRAISILMLHEAVKKKHPTNRTKNQYPIIKYKETIFIATHSIKRNMSPPIQRVRGKPVCGNESTERCVLTPKHVENDQISAERPVTVDQKEEHKIDFRGPGLSHAVVEEAEHLRVQEHVKKIESHPHREAFHADLQQNNVYNPLSKNSKEMIRELDNVVLLELCETTPKSTMFSLSFFIGITELCYTCLIDSESRRNFEPNYEWTHYLSRTTWSSKDLLMVLDMARPKYKKSTIRLGTRGRDAVRKSTLKVDILQVFTIGFSAIQFIVNHNSQSDGQNKCKEWDELAKEDHTYKLTPGKREWYQGQWYLTLNKASKNGPMCGVRKDVLSVKSSKMRQMLGTQWCHWERWLSQVSR